MAGAALLKPNMQHIETKPDIFVPWETYVPVRWDLADLATAAHTLLDDVPMRRRIAEAAFNVVRDYLCSDSFTDQMAPLFEER
jgi:hypothetical protein